jgi:hypothetical protein
MIISINNSSSSGSSSVSSSIMISGVATGYVFIMCKREVGFDI